MPKSRPRLPISKDLLKWNHDQLSTYGIGKEYSEATWKHLAQQFLCLGLLKQVTGTGSLKLTDKGWAVCNGEQVWGTLAKVTETAAIAEAGQYNAELFAQLRRLRKTLADREQVPPYIIFSDRALQEMANYCPQSMTAFGQIHGVGQIKLEKYGERFLAVLRDFCNQHNLTEQPRPRITSVTPSVVKPRSLAVGERFRAGASVTELQHEYQVQRETILQRLANFVGAGQSPIHHPLAS